MKGEDFIRPIYEEEELEEHDEAPPPNIYAVFWCIGLFAGITLGVGCLISEPDLIDEDEIAFYCLLAMLTIEISSFIIAGATIVCCAVGSFCMNSYDGMNSLAGMFIVCGLSLIKVAHVMAVPVCVYMLFSSHPMPLILQVFLATEMLIGCALIAKICSCADTESAEISAQFGPAHFTAQELRYYENEVREARSNSNSLERITELSVRGASQDRRSVSNHLSNPKKVEGRLRSISTELPKLNRKVQQA